MTAVVLWSPQPWSQIKMAMGNIHADSGFARLHLRAKSRARPRPRVGIGDQRVGGLGELASQEARAASGVAALASRHNPRVGRPEYWTRRRRDHELAKWGGGVAWVRN
jgi:hypothetical protein